MTARWLLATLAAFAGVASGPFLSAAIGRFLARRSSPSLPATGFAAPRSRAIGLSVTVGAAEALAALRLGASWNLLPVAMFLAGAAALAWSDACFLLLPKTIHYRTTGAVAALLVVAAAGTGRWSGLATAAACGAGAFVVFLAMNLVSPSAMAFGDVRLAGLVGLMAGWFGVGRALDAFVAASLVAATVAVVLLGLRRIRLGSHLPYGVFLALGAVIAILA